MVVASGLARVRGLHIVAWMGGRDKEGLPRAIAFINLATDCGLAGTESRL